MKVFPYKTKNPVTGSNTNLLQYQPAPLLPLSIYGKFSIRRASAWLYQANVAVLCWLFNTLRNEGISVEDFKLHTSKLTF